MDLSDELRQTLISKGACAVGYADLLEIPEQKRKGYRYGVSIVVALQPEMVGWAGRRRPMAARLTCTVVGSRTVA